MSIPTVIFALLGVGVGLGLTLIAATLIPAAPHLGETLERLRDSGHRQSAPAAVVPAGSSWLERFGGWLSSRVPSPPGLSPAYADLQIMGMTRARFGAVQALYAALGFLTPTIILTAYIVFLGIGIPPAAPPLLGIVCAAVAWVLPLMMLRRNAVTARQRFARSVTTYIDLVVLARIGDAGVASAIRKPADYANAPLFLRIRESLNRWTLQRVPPWEALGKLADELQLPELAELADTMEQSGTQASAVADTLTARATDIRSRFLNQDIAAARVGVQRLGVAVGLLFVCFLSYLLVPYMSVLLGP